MQWKRGSLIRLPLFCQSRASASFSGKLFWEKTFTDTLAGALLPAPN